MEQDLTRTNSGITREGFGTSELIPQSETGAAAIAAREQAAVQARYIMALQRPRDMERFRVRLLQECKRLGFAETAEYSRPVGKEKDQQTGKWSTIIARGPSIRLIEAALRHFGNVDAEAQVVFENAEGRVVRCRVIDLESNSSWTQDIAISKRVEKRGWDGKPPAGRHVVGQRINSENEVTYLVAATDDETNVRQMALVSKAQRKNAERLLPSDIIAEAIIECRAVVEKGLKADPQGQMRKTIDAFAELRIEPAELAAYIGKPLERMQPADIAELRRVFAAIKDGEMNWEDAVGERQTGSLEAQKEVMNKRLAELSQKAGAGPESAAPAVKSQAEAAAAQEPQTDPRSLPISNEQYMDMMDAAQAAGLSLAQVTAIAQSVGFETGEKVSVACYDSMLAKVKAGRPAPKDATGTPAVSFPKRGAK
jgi:hypothetical protein